jgi:vacuolar-type H+-ATPase subunit H
MAEKLTGAVQAMEEQAARLLAEASSEGEEILRAARSRAGDIEAAPLSLDEVRAECQRRVEAAQSRAEEILSRAEGEADALRRGAEDKVEDCIRQIVQIVSGAGA